MLTTLTALSQGSTEQSPNAEEKQLLKVGYVIAVKVDDQTHRIARGIHRGLFCV